MRYSLAMLAALTGYSPTAVADSEIDYLFELSLEELMLIEVSTASLTDESFTSVSAAMSVFTRSEIARMPVTYLHELLVYVPGYQSVRELDYSYGFSMSSRARKTGAAGREILFLLNGVPANNPRNGSATSMFMYPVEMIERVEVLRGPGSALYGTNAITGVVSITTRTDTNTVTMGAGEFNNKQISGFYSQDVGEVSYSFSTFLAQDDGDNFSLPDTFSNNRVDTTDPLSQRHFHLVAKSENTLFQLQHRKLNADDFYNTGRVSNQYNFSRFKSTILSLHHSFSLIDGIDSELTTSFTRTQSQNGNQSTPEGAFAAISTPSSNAPLYGYGEFKSSRLNLDVRSSYIAENKGKVTFGFGVKRELLDEAKGYTNYDLTQLSSGSFPITYFGELGSGVPIAEEVALNSTNVFGLYQRDFGQGWLVTAGARYDYYERFAAKLTPRLSVIKQVSDSHTVKLIYGEAFRVPDLMEVSFRNTLSVAGNPDLRHESMSNWDLIWLGQWPSFQLQAGVFYSQFEDPIVNIINNGIRTLVNGDEDSYWGAEFEAQWQPEERWYVRLTASFNDDLPESAYREAANSGSLHINYQLDRANINVSTTYNSSRLTQISDDAFLSLPSVWLLNTKYTVDVAEHWRVIFQVSNVTDKMYFTPVNGSALVEGMPNRGREWWLGANYTF